MILIDRGLDSDLFPINTSYQLTIRLLISARGGAVAARWAHNPKVAGSSPAPATKIRLMFLRFSVCITM